MTRLARAARIGVLVMAHGTPARLDELGAFYTEIRRGRPPSAGELADLERRYRAIGGTSPLNAMTQAQADGIAAALDASDPGHFSVRVGTRFSEPRIEAALAALLDDGCDAIVGLVLAPHSSMASVAEYERRLRGALEHEVAKAPGPPFVMIDHWFDEPDFEPLVGERVRAAMAELDDATVIFTAHSIPTALVDAGDTYPGQVRSSAAGAAVAAGLDRFSVGWQSAGRSGGEWLGPDVRDLITELAADGAAAVVVCPIGLVSDHLEVLYDIDIEARAVAEQTGIAFARTASFNAAPDFCDFLAGVVSRAAGTA